MTNANRETASAAVTPLHTSPMAWADHVVEQHVDYPEHTAKQRVLELLSQLAVPVMADSLTLCKARLAQAQRGHVFVLQMGDCSEPIVDAHSDAVIRKIAFMNEAAALLGEGLGKPVLKLGRIAGQFAKPRSSPQEARNGIILPAFRGESINGHHFDAAARTPNPLRLLSAYFASRKVHEQIHARHSVPNTHVSENDRVFTSHEALNLPFEHALSRFDPNLGRYNGAGHLLWIGKRTSHPDHAHVQYCAQLVNPIAVKVSAETSVARIQALCTRLNPRNQRGRLAFISRMGRGNVESVLPGLLQGLKQIGAEFSWMCDPMHGNTFSADNGIKTRALADMREELAVTVGVLARHALPLAGLHLESSPDDVVECVSSRTAHDELVALGTHFTSTCDPRLSRPQTLELLRWLTSHLTGASAS